MKTRSAFAPTAFALAAVTGALMATTAVAQTAKAPAWTPPPGMGAQMPMSGFGADVWSVMAVRRADENALKIVDKGGWSRAREAAAAINGGRCGEAGIIAAQAQDTRLMEGVKRACKYG